MEKTAQITLFNDLAAKWDTLTGNEPDKLRCLVELCALQPGARVLDVACGTGGLTTYFLEKNPATILGVDFAPRMIEKAAEKYRSPEVSFRCVDIMELAGEKFDCAVLNNAFPYFENRGSLTRQLHHLLDNGGRIMICHAQGRTKVNSQHQLTANLALPLPTAQTLAGTLAQYFDVDTMIDSNAFYVVSGIRRNL